MLAVLVFRYGLSYRDVEELLAERGVQVDHVTIYRWVQRFPPLLIDAAPPCRHVPGDQWFADETYARVAGLGLLLPSDRPVRPGHRRTGVREAGLGSHPPVLHPGSRSRHPPQRGAASNSFALPNGSAPDTAFIQNACRGHYELGIDADPKRQLPAAFAELALAI